MSYRCLFAQCLMLPLLWACSSTPVVTNVDLTMQKGVYLVGYAQEEKVRRDFEDELKSNLLAGGMLAFASYMDIPDISQSNADEVFQQAVKRGVVAIIVVNNAEDSQVEDVRRLQPGTPGVRKHFERIKKQRIVESSADVTLEVNAFAIDGDSAALAWSGVTAVFSPESRSGAIEDLSENIASALRSAQQRVRSRP